MVAVRNFLPEDPALLAFHKGDIIHLQPLEPPRMGQGRGTQGGREAEAGPGASLAGADVGLTPRLQCRLRGPQEGRVPGGTAAQRPRLRWIPLGPPRPASRPPKSGNPKQLCLAPGTHTAHAQRGSLGAPEASGLARPSRASASAQSVPPGGCLARPPVCRPR